MANMPGVLPVIMLRYILCGLVTQLALAATQLSIRAPVNPVSLGGILSVHCQIWGLQNDHEYHDLQNC